MAAAAAVQPSPFAALLRRSRFASYDPAIAQVYTAHDGDAHRGNYGFKRPFPLRRRHGFVTVHNVDSKAQQTEFNRAESRARFIRRWQEVGGPVEAKESNWAKRAGNAPALMDSEFAPLARSQELEAKESQERAKALARSGQLASRSAAAAPDAQSRESYNSSRSGSVKLLSKMSPRQFERYLAQLRSIRPQFQEYVRKTAPGRNITERSPHALSSNVNNLHREFIASYTDKWLQSGTARSFAQSPHPNGALAYSHPSHLQSLFTTAPQPGLVLMNGRPMDFANRGNRDTRTGAHFVSFAGLTATLRSTGGKPPLLDTNAGINPETAEQSVGMFRMARNPKMIMVPNVVGRLQQGTKAAQIEAEVYLDEKPDFAQTVYPPGTRQSISPPFDDAQRPYLFVPSSEPKIWRRPGSKNSAHGTQDFLNAVTGMVSRSA